ncbi:hypothetical protein RhiJN_28368 [Ceratobasidium sp. AG-Ba]|nr:hypothetical protein RhiJN_28368 [Ceratobasidium sp. AG-Ba]
MPSTPFARNTDWHFSHAAPLMEAKDKRAFNSDRQRAMHGGDRRKSKGGSYKPPRHSSRGTYGTDTDYDFAVEGIEYEEQDDPVLPDYEPDVGVARPRPGPQVSLADIAKPGRTRKGVAGDFEIVSRPGTVLTLPINEGFEEEDEDLYVGWEDVSETGGSRSGKGAASNARPGSYAAALSTHR